VGIIFSKNRTAWELIFKERHLLERSKAKNPQALYNSKFSICLFMERKKLSPALEAGLHHYHEAVRMMMDFGETVSHIYNECRVVFEP